MTTRLSYNLASKDFRKVTCDIPCEIYGKRPGVCNVLYALDFEHPDHTTILESSEAAHYYPQLLNSAPHLGMSSVDIGRTADIPFSYYNFYTGYRLHESHSIPWDIQTPQPKNQLDHLLVVISNCGSKSNRNQWVSELQKHENLVHSIAGCSKNTNQYGTDFDKGALTKKYKFLAAFENGHSRGYVTEKFWGALRFGSIPVVLGAPNVEELVPPGSYINALDFSDGVDLGHYLKYLMRSETALNAYHDYRRKPLPYWFVDLYNFTKTDVFCIGTSFTPPNPPPTTEKDVTEVLIRFISSGFFKPENKVVNDQS